RRGRCGACASVVEHGAPDTAPGARLVDASAHGAGECLRRHPVDRCRTDSVTRPPGLVDFREANPLLGPRPSVGRVNSYTALAGLSVLGAAAVAPPRLRPWLLGAAVAVQLFTIQGSVRQGIPIRFP